MVEITGFEGNLNNLAIA
ncbi:MAG: hypothetical protein AB4063_08670 [Crocosphaera sp.]